MFYPRDQFFRLMEAIEEDGGEHLDAVHEHSVYDHYAGGPIQDPAQGYIKNCGESALFEVPYEPYNGNTLHTVIVCAVDDGMGLWPRYASAQAPGDWSG